MYRLDRTLARLLDRVDDAVGLDRTLVFLTADHGFDDIPEEHLRLHHPGGRLRPRQMLDRARAHLQQRFGVSEDLIASFWPPSVYLDHAKVEAAGLSLTDVERVLARFLQQQPGIAHAMTRTDLLAGHAGGSEVLQRLLRAFHPKRSGDVLLVGEQFWYVHIVADADPAMHGSPYNYDTHVPLIMSGPGIDRGVVHDRVGPEQIAATVSTYLGIGAPSSAHTHVLPGVFPR